MNDKVLAERDGYRAVLMHEDSPSEPMNDGAVPQFTASYEHGRWSVGCEQNTEQLHASAQSLLDVWFNFRIRFARDEERASEVFARYCRAVFGAEYVRITDYHGYGQGSEFKLFEIAPFGWCEKMGVDVEQLVKEETEYVPELVSYAIGDVWWIKVEKLTKYVNVLDPEDTIESWVMVDNCSGYYGEDDTAYFVEEAERMITEQI